eukprot:1159887-Pelagomonas_calceolata.AAC.4
MEGKKCNLFRAGDVVIVHVAQPWQVVLPWLLWLSIRTHMRVLSLSRTRARTHTQGIVSIRERMENWDEQEGQQG